MAGIKYWDIMHTCILLSKCQRLNCIVRESNPGRPRGRRVLYLKSYLHCKKSWRKTPPACTVYLCQYSVHLRQYCVFLRQYCVFLRQYCVKLRQYCVFLRQYCVKLRQYCVFLQILCNYSTPPPTTPQASIHVYLHYSGRGRGSPATNQPPPPEYPFWPLNCPSLRSGQFKGSKKSWPPQNVPWNGS